MGDIINPPTHTHRPVMEGGQAICQDCRQVVISPILEADDPRLRDGTWSHENAVAAVELAVNGQPAEFWLGAIKSVCPAPLDYILIEMAKHLDTPLGYVEDIMDAYDEAPEPGPPHTLNDSATDWWVTE